MEKTTERAVQDFKRGEDREENARLLFRRFHGQVTRFFISKRFSAEDSEELAEDVFVSVFNNMDQLREEAKFENWVCRIAMNIYKNELERRGAKKRAGTEIPLESDPNGLDDPAELVAPKANPEALVLERERLEKVREALHQLPQQMRHCVVLRVDNELSYAEIASIMDISPNTVSAHLHQARKLLKERLSEYFGDVVF
jgi:RNA polymerase sigma-70 factor (ECF subfamily)